MPNDRRMSVQKYNLFLFVLIFYSSSLFSVKKPNVLLIVCDDLNDYIETLGGHPQTKTPNIRKLIESGVSFTQAHCNIPICNPSRASFATGIYPHTSQQFGFEDWDKNEILKNSRTMMDHFGQNGYHTLGTGKVMHNRDHQEWKEFGHPSDYGPFLFDGKDKIPNLSVPAPFRDDFGIIDGNFGPLENVMNQKSPKTGKSYSWVTGGWKKQREMKYNSDEDRDPTGDELNTQWAVNRLTELAKSKEKKPFFMGVGFVRPHTPLIVPQKHFDLFPIESIKLPKILKADAEDTFKNTVTSKEDDRSGDRGTKMYDSLLASYDGNRELALKKFIQAYLASVASVDDLVGEILETLQETELDKNTIVIFTSDHGWGNGEKDYLYKNSLWQESTRVPLIIRAPGVSEENKECEQPVSLVDLYPTLLDLCGLPDNTMKNDKGRPLDGFSMRPFLNDPKNGKWDGPDYAITALYKWAQYYDPAFQNYSLRFKDWRYIRYENGKEELYHTAKDDHEWNNLAQNSKFEKELTGFRKNLLAIIPESIPEKPKSNEYWKDQFFKKNPSADTNGDGTLSWAELTAHRKMPEEEKKALQNELWKTSYFKKNPVADSNKDGKLSWPEFNAHKKQNN
jgi:arylsulfatase A-like enzyme